MGLNKKIAFLGGGNMAEALIKGIIAAGAATPGQILATDISADRLAHLNKTYGIIIQKTNAGAFGGAGIVVLSIKPQVMDRVLAEIAPASDADTLVISIAAGVTISK